MKIFMLVDMEGISGIRMLEQVKRDQPAFFPEGQRLMIDEVNNAVDALFSAGVSEVTVMDSHAMGGQLELSRMDGRADYETPNAGRMMPSLDESYAGLVLLGAHAMAGTHGGFLDHTFNSASWFRYAVNGIEAGEIACQAAYAGHFGVPVLAVTGDAMTAVEARRFLGEDLPVAVVKEGIGRNRARCLSVERAHELVRKTLRQALGTADRRAPFRFDLPATLELTLYRQDMADDMQRQPEWERVDARTVRRTIDSLRHIYPC